MAELPGQRQRDSEWGLRCAVVAVGALLLSTVGASGQPAPVIGQEGKDVPWVPTPEVLVDTMLEMAAVGPGDYVMDLGSGDGRTVIAATRLGARAVGVELDPRLVAASKQYAIEAGVADRTEFLATDLFDVDLSRATVITMFLLPDINTRLRPSPLALEPGTRIVSNTWDMGGSESDPDAPGWIPDETVVLDPCPSFCTSLFWIVPANVSGTWRLVDQEQEAELELAQEFQITSGRLLTNGRIEDVGEGRPRGREISFSIGDTSYRGRVDGDTMTGTARADDGTSKWRAARVNCGRGTTTAASRYSRDIKGTSSMNSIKETAERFFDACETGKGWDECQQYCEPDASFSAQAGALADIETLQAYTDWMKGLLTPVPDGWYELRSFAVDEGRHNVTAYAVFRGTHTAEGGPVPPTGQQIEADYVYVMQFEGDKIRHMTKIWNDGISLQQLGWA